MPLTRNIPPDDWFEAVTLPTPGSFRLGKQALFLAAVSLGLTAACLFGQGRATWELRLLASAIIVVGVVPMWLWLSGLDRDMPFFAFFGTIYAAYYALPVFFLDDYQVGMAGGSMPDSLIVRALALALAGLVCLLLGFYGPQRWLMNAVLPHFNLRWSNHRNVKFWGIMFGIAGLGAFLVSAFVKLPMAVEQLAFFGGSLCDVGACMLFALQLTGGLDGPSKLLLWGAIVPARVMLGLATGLATMGFIFILMLVLFYATLTHSVPWTTLLVGFLALMLVRPVMAPFRALTWQGGAMAGLSPAAKVAAFAELTGEILSNQTSYDASVQYVLSRLLATLPLAEVMRDTPDHVPYWGGATLSKMIFKPIPRLLYPDKPLEDTGQTFGHRYGVLDPSDYLTSFNFPLLVELYANFGLLGVLFGMTLYGIIYRAALQIFVHPGMGLGGVIAATFISMKFLNLESSAGLVFGGVLWSFVFIGLIHLVVDTAELSGSGLARPASALRGRQARSLVV